MRDNMATIDIDQRKQQFIKRTTPLIFVVIAATTMICELVNYFIFGHWFFWVGTTALCFITTVTLTIRNFRYVLQQSVRDFTDSSKHVSLFWYLLVVNILIIFMAILPPNKELTIIFPKGEGSGLGFILTFLVFSMIVNALNLYAPVWVRQREILEVESVILINEKRELEEKFKELGMQDLEAMVKRQRGTEEVREHEKVTLEILAERMMDIQKLLKFTIQNQRILLSRQDTSANKLIMAVLFFSFNLIALIAFSLKAVQINLV